MNTVKTTFYCECPCFRYILPHLQNIVKCLSDLVVSNVLFFYLSLMFESS